MFCDRCYRKIQECDCRKPAPLNGRWPSGTWFQKRLEKVRIMQAVKKTLTRDAGSAAINLVSFLAMMGLIIGGLFVLAKVGNALIDFWGSLGRCIEALLECRNI